MQRPAINCAASQYPVPYFLCDRLTDAKALKDLLGLDKKPKLRKARIVGYQRAAGDSESTVEYDGYNFGEWSGEEVVKGVVYEATCAEEARKIRDYVGNGSEVQSISLEVACPTILGAFGKMKTVIGRIFVLGGEGDTLVGSRRSMMSGSTVREGEFVSSGRESLALRAEPDAEGVEVNGVGYELDEMTPRMAPEHETTLEAAIPQLSVATRREYSEPVHQEPTREEPRSSLNTVTTGNTATDEAIPEEEDKPIEATTAHGPDHVPVAELLQQEEPPALAAQISTTSSRKESAPPSLRSVLTSNTHRKTSDSIKSLVMKYEGLSPQLTPQTEA
ncbi:hypothetical protein EJ02DRAFT_461251 [Clathrospora elynae]|uniref:Gamma-glutamylcyclotransferase AIG2-like domain-containing protein n=1 Tax=Clathrospora elynae TaxID=706981 RepID=A0A6A5T504_9PLEO|nr:hypothetical protein EJ02DRAFT_461251 [Clathrospora elynae]